MILSGNSKNFSDPNLLLPKNALENALEDPVWKIKNSVDLASDEKELLKLENEKLHEKLAALNDKAERYYQSMKSTSRLNDELEEKILSLVEKFNNEKTDLEKNRDEYKEKLEHAVNYIGELEQERNRFRDDCIVAVQLLQTNPSIYKNQRIEALPIELQCKIKKLEDDIHQSPPISPFASESRAFNSLQEKQNEGERTRHSKFEVKPSSTYFTATFPPTAMTLPIQYSQNAGVNPALKMISTSETTNESREISAAKIASFLPTSSLLENPTVINQSDNENQSLFTPSEIYLTPETMSYKRRQKGTVFDV